MEKNMVPPLTKDDFRLVGCEVEDYTDENFSGHSYAKEVILTLFARKSTIVSLIVILLIGRHGRFCPHFQPLHVQRGQRQGNQPAHAHTGN